MSICCQTSHNKCCTLLINLTIFLIALVKYEQMLYNVINFTVTEVIIVNKAVKIKYYINSLCIYDFKKDEIVNSLYDLLTSVDDETVLSKQARFFNLVSQHSSFKHYLSRQILINDNIFTRAAAAGKVNELDESVIEGVRSDLAKLEYIASITADDICAIEPNEDVAEILKTMPKWNVNGRAAAPLTEGWDGQLEQIADYHAEKGYGIYAKHIAFTWRNGELCPVNSIDPIRLSDLKNYETQRQSVVDNTESFIKGHPANNVLLYGDRGTGKSSTVHAILNEYSSMGLRMIEIPKSTVSELSLIREAIAGVPLHFIIYIDDLSFDSNDSSFSELKAALEGSLTGKQANTIIYATSNRRHLIRESVSDRQNEVNLNDIMQEQLSLSDRFGLTITFTNPDKKNYLEILEKICDDRGLDVDKEHLFFEAERWAIRRGGRSPRCAKQFADYVESCILAGKEW